MRHYLIIIASIISFCSNAQVDFTGGILAGGVASQISGDGLGGWDKFGVRAGGWIHMDYNGVYGTQLGIEYVNKGSAKQADVNNGDYNQFSFRLHYMEVPILLTYSLKNFRFGIGPSVGILISQKVDFNGAVGEPSPPFETLDFSGNLSVAWIIGDHSLLEFRGSSSFIPTRPAPAVVNKLSYYEQGNYNQVIGLSYMFRF